MRQILLLAASFGLTMVGLVGALLVISMFGGPGDPAASPSAEPSATAFALATPVPSPSVRQPPIASSSASAAATDPNPSTVQATPRPSATPRLTVTPRPSSGPAGTIEVVVRGRDYFTTNATEPGEITFQPNGGIVMETGRALTNAVAVDYRVPPGSIPSGRSIVSIDTKVCGSGSGDFWEAYGPDGGEPDEYEARDPEADGCWHFTGAPGPDSTTRAATQYQSKMRVDQVIYTIVLR